MNTLALAIVLFSAVLHATWNLLAKRTRGGATFVWLYDVVSVVIYAPLALYLIAVQHSSLSITGLIFIVGSAILHLFYFVLLQRGYRSGDLSLVYPLARGTGPLLSTTLAIVLLGERPTAIALVGVALIVAGVFVITGGIRVFKGGNIRWALLYGMLTGLFIAAYTLWDKQAVSAFLISPAIFYYSSIVVRMALLSPYAWLHRENVYQEWRSYRFEAVGVAILSPLSYFLVLYVLVFTPVSYVAPAREVGVLFGTIMGIRLLAEGESRRRLIAAGMILLGIIALAI
ncbi:MAG: EamA family transporter [Chloroflexi bacterium]|nr:EamA family transporter [Chloroflexota bacterium]